MATIKKSDVAPSAAAVFKTIDNKLNDPGGGCSTALDRHELTVLYEDRLNDMGNAGRNGGQYSAGVKAVVLFFKKGGKTTKPIHYYELDLKGVSLGKTRPLRESDLAEFEQLVSEDGRARTPAAPHCKQHWTIDPASVDKTTYDLSVRNPNIEEEKLPSSKECLKRLNALNLGIAKLLKELA